jgi:hypothetical protein
MALRTTCDGWAGLSAKWQAGPSDAEQQGGVREPLLGKAQGDGGPDDPISKEDQRQTICFLSTMAVADGHILLCAFTAGDASGPAPA